MKTKILRQLRTTNEYVSGQMLCDELGVSRTAVWKAINQLKEEGYTIEAVQNKGYKITGYPDILTAEEIESQLNPGDTVKKVVYAPEIDSTNNEAKRRHTLYYGKPDRRQGQAGQTMGVSVRKRNLDDIAVTSAD